MINPTTILAADSATVDGTNYLSNNFNLFLKEKLINLFFFNSL